MFGLRRFGGRTRKDSGNEKHRSFVVFSHCRMVSSSLFLLAIIAISGVSCEDSNDFNPRVIKVKREAERMARKAFENAVEAALKGQKFTDTENSNPLEMRESKYLGENGEKERPRVRGEMAEKEEKPIDTGSQVLESIQISDSESNNVNMEDKKEIDHPIGENERTRVAGEMAEKEETSIDTGSLEFDSSPIINNGNVNLEEMRKIDHQKQKEENEETIVIAWVEKKEETPIDTGSELESSQITNGDSVNMKEMWNIDNPQPKVKNEEIKEIEEVEKKEKTPIDTGSELESSQITESDKANMKDMKEIDRSNQKDENERARERYDVEMTETIRRLFADGKEEKPIDIGLGRMGGDQPANGPPVEVSSSNVVPGGAILGVSSDIAPGGAYDVALGASFGVVPIGAELRYEAEDGEEILICSDQPKTTTKGIVTNVPGAEATTQSGQSNVAEDAPAAKSTIQLGYSMVTVVPILVYLYSILA